MVDRSLSPPFAVDASHLTVTAEGLATKPQRPARVSAAGRVGANSRFDVAGTIGPLAGPPKVDVSGKLERFWVPRTDSYLSRYVGWEAREGWLTTDVRCRIDGGTLEARSDIRLSQLDLVRGSHDEAQRRIGLPLGLIVSLMKDSRGDIAISLPVSGRLTDPRFDFSEAIWSTVRNVAIKAITLPVSWIGRVRLTADSKVDRIEVDPVEFAAGTAAPTADGAAQVRRLARFLEQAPGARMVLTPVIAPAGSRRAAPSGRRRGHRRPRARRADLAGRGGAAPLPAAASRRGRRPTPPTRHETRWPAPSLFGRRRRPIWRRSAWKR